MRKYTRNCNNDRKNVCGPRSSFLPTNIDLFLLKDVNIMMVQSHLLLWGRAIHIRNTYVFNKYAFLTKKHPHQPVKYWLSTNIDYYD